MEASIGRFKTENHSLFLGAATLEELSEVVEERMRYYNRVRRHSALGYRAPYQFLLPLGWEGWASQSPGVERVQRLGWTSEADAGDSCVVPSSSPSWRRSCVSLGRESCKAYQAWLRDAASQEL